MSKLCQQTAYCIVHEQLPCNRKIIKSYLRLTLNVNIIQTIDQVVLSSMRNPTARQHLLRISSHRSL